MWPKPTGKVAASYVLLERSSPQVSAGTSTLFHKFCISEWQFEIILYFIHFAPALKSEIRISKHETNSNDRNLNDKNGKGHHQTAFVLNFEHSYFDIVSDFGFRYSYFRNG